MLRQFRRGVGGDGSAFEVADRLKGRHCIDPCLARFIGQCQRVAHRLHLRVLELRLGSGDALFAGAGIQQVHGDHAFQGTVKPDLRRADAQ